MEQNRNITTTTTISLESIGLITFIVFLILKLTGTLNINWFWVWFPLWIPIAVSMAIYLIFVIIALLVALFTKE